MSQLFKIISFTFTLSLSLTLSSYSQPPILWTSSWSPDGAHILVGGNDGILRIYNGETFELIKRDTLGDEVTIQRMDWHPKKNVVALGMTGSEFYLINFDNGKKTTLKGDFGWTRGIGWSYNGKYLAAGDGGGVLHIWNSKGEEIQTINKANTKSFVALDWHPSKNEVTALSQYIYRYNVQGKLLSMTQHRAENVLMLSIDWHPSGDFFALGDYGDPDVPHPPVLQFWDKKGEDVQEFWESEAEYRNVRWSPDGELLATASDALRIWTKEGKLLHTAASPDKLWGIDWSPDGQFIITSGEEGHIIVWNKAAKLVRELEQ